MKVDEKIRVQFKEYDCLVVKQGEHIILEQWDQMCEAYMEDPSPIAMATIQHPEITVPDGFVMIKDYSENEGMLDVLVEAGIVAKPQFRAKISPWVTVPICEVLI